MTKVARDASRLSLVVRGPHIRLWLLVTSLTQAAAPSTVRDSGVQAPESVETRVRNRIDGHVEKAQLLFQPNPKYPPEAMKAGVHGRVRLQAVVGKNGSIKKLKVISGEPLLVKAAVDAVSQWRYKPILIAGQPVEVETEIYVIFKLPKKRP